MEDSPEMARGSGGLLDSDGVAEAKRTQEDIALVGRAVREGWPVPTAKRTTVVGRLVEVVEKRSVKTVTADGVFDDERSADSNAIRAAGVLCVMTGQNQTDDWNQDKNYRMDHGKLTENVGIMPAVVEQPVRSSG